MNFDFLPPELRALGPQFLAGIAGVSLIGLIAVLGLAAGGPGGGSLGGGTTPTTTTPTTTIPATTTATTAPTTTTTPAGPGDYEPPITSLPDFDGVLGSDGTKFRVIACESEDNRPGESDATIQVRGTTPFEGKGTAHWVIDDGVDENLLDFRPIEGTFSMYLAGLVPAPKRFDPVFTYENGEDISISYSYSQPGQLGPTHTVEINASEIVRSCPLEIPVEPEFPAGSIQTEGPYSFAVLCHPGRNVIVARAWTTDPDHRFFSGWIRADDEADNWSTSHILRDDAMAVLGAEIYKELELNSFAVHMKLQRTDVNNNVSGPVITKVFDGC